MLRWLVFLFFIFVVRHSLQAQNDTLAPKPTFSNRIDRFSSTRVYQMTYVGIPLVVGALIVKNEDNHFRNLRQSYAPSFKWHYDDYLQYAPAGLMLGLKACGVKSRSSWGRMLVSSGFSIGLMTAVVNPIKYAARVMRPDGSGRNSFPSGHTATAFMTATMLHKEYGWRSPWYSVAGYSVATFTGVSRMLNNRHWLSDVMAGAGIGILTTELGYFLADLIYKDRGIADISYNESFDLLWKPSFFGLFFGFDIVPGVVRPYYNTTVNLSTGANVGVEGACFLTPYFGIGGQLSVASMSFSVNNVPHTSPLKSWAAKAGAYFSYPISFRWRAGAKILAGYYGYEDCVAGQVRLGDTGDVTLGTGVSMMYRAKQNLSVRFFCDYTPAPPLVPNSRQRVNIITLGGSANIVF